MAYLRISILREILSEQRVEFELFKTFFIVSYCLTYYKDTYLKIKKTQTGLEEFNLWMNK